MTVIEFERCRTCGKPTFLPFAAGCCSQECSEIFQTEFRLSPQRLLNEIIAVLNVHLTQIAWTPNPPHDEITKALEKAICPILDSYGIRDHEVQVTPYMTSFRVAWIRRAPPRDPIPAGAETAK